MAEGPLGWQEGDDLCWMSRRSSAVGLGLRVLCGCGLFSDSLLGLQRPALGPFHGGRDQGLLRAPQSGRLLRAQRLSL